MGQTSRGGEEIRRGGRGDARRWQQGKEGLEKRGEEGEEKGGGRGGEERWARRGEEGINRRMRSEAWMARVARSALGVVDQGTHGGGDEKARGRGRAEGRGRHEPPAAPRKTTKEKGRPPLDDISEMSERLVRELGVARASAKTLLRVRALRERRQRKGCGPELADAEPASPSSSTSDSKAATAPSVASPAACTAASPAAFAAVAPTASPAATQITPPAAPSTSPTAAADGPVPDELQADWSFEKRCAPLSLTPASCAFCVFGVCYGARTCVGDALGAFV